MIRAFTLVGLVAAVASGGVPVHARAPIESTYAEHARGVALAREGRHDAGLALLYPLLARFPHDYPLRRDVVLINAWKGDCRRALRDFAPIGDHPRIDDYLIGPVAECAAQRARAGEHDAAIEVLAALLPHASDPYPLRRDLTLITIWSGDCRRALRWFDPIRNDARAPAYLIEPVVNCMRREGRRTEALTILNAGLQRYPGDPGLQLARTRIELALRVDDNHGDTNPVLTFGLSTSASDRGAREWLARTELSTGINESLRVYARYLRSRANETAFEAGEMNRVGAGLRWYPEVRLLVDLGLSTDTESSGLTGAHALVQYRPYDTWRLALGHDTYAEDISVRARASAIEADRTQASAQYTGIDYRWQWRGVAGRYDFSDTNRRTDLYTTLGYAFELAPAREQRLYAEWYQSRNTLPGAPYFSPPSDRSVALIHRIDFVFDSRFKRHVDHFSWWFGSYRQEGFGAKPRWGVRYEQDYDFSSDSALNAGLGFYRNVYDGQREDEWRFDVTYRLRF